MYTYQLIEGGYLITNEDGTERIVQTWNRFKAGYDPMTPEEADADAQARIAELEANAAQA